MKRKAKLTLGTLMACLIVGNVGFAENQLVHYNNIGITANAIKVVHGVDKITELGNSNYEGNIDESGKVYGILATDEGTANLTNENIAIKVINSNENGDTYGVAASVFKGKGEKPDFTHGGIVNLGTKNTKNINIMVNASGYATGITAMRHINDSSAKPAFVNVKGENLVIDVYSENSTAAGIWAQNNTGILSNPSTVTISTDNTYIKTESGIDDTVGIVAMSSSKVVVDSNLYIDAQDAILTRGNSTININESGEKFTKLNGNLNFNYDGPTSGTEVNSNVFINLTGEESYWNGNTEVSWNYEIKDGNKPTENKLNVDNLNVTLANGAQWNPNKVIKSSEDYTNNGKEYTYGNKYVALNNLTLNNGIINLENMQEQTLEIENIKGTNGTVNVASSDNKLAITKKNDINSLTVAANQDYSEQLVQNDMGVSLQNLVDQVVDSTATGNGKSAATGAYLSETAVTGVTTAQVDENGKVILKTINERVNPSNNAISNMAGIALMAWRAENNDMNKRLGELRDSKGEHGIWARMVRGEGTYESIKNQYNTYQLGYDEKLSTNPNWTVGAAVSYTEGESGFNGGSGENKHTGFSVYGSYLNDDGSFIDLIAKYARLDHDFDVIGGAGSGDYETNGYSVSAEYGKRFKQDNGMWIEPQVELTYGKIGSANYKTDNGVSVRQDGMDSLVGRIGFALGKDFKQGNAYVRASYLYDFEGETDISFTKGNVTRGFEQDLGGGWFEVGVGTNINLSDATHLYMDIEKTYGGDIATPWQWNIGVRYSF